MIELFFWISLILLTGSHLFGIYLAKATPSIGTPSTIIFAYSLAKTAPYSLLTFLDKTIIDQRVLQGMQQIGAEETIVIFNSLYSIFVFCIAISLRVVGGYKLERFAIKRITSLRLKESIQGNSLAFWVFLIASFCLAYYKYKAIGGLDATIFSTAFDRGESTAGSGYVKTLADTALSLVSTLALIAYLRDRSRKHLLLFILTLLVATLSFSLTGGRKALLQHSIIMLAIAYAYGARPKIISPKPALFVAALLVYFLGILYQRLPETQREIAFEQRGSIAKTIVVSFLANFSYNETYYFIIGQSSFHKIYSGATFADIIMAPIPSSAYPEKPPIDEGVYVKAAADGHYIVPPIAYKNFEGAGSWPPETFGNFIMNFSILSIPIASAFYAVGITLIIRLTKHLPPALALYIIYHSALNFQISNLRIMNLLSLLIIGGAAFFFLYYLPKQIFAKQKSLPPIIHK